MPRHQRGQALIAITVLLGITLLVTVYAMTQSINQAAIDNQKTADALAQAKTALIGWAASNPNRPGELPCPDINNDGIEDPPSGNCQKLLGRLPWSTLGLPDMRDGSGERLWYALSSGFQPGNTDSINSDTIGTLGTITVYDSQGNSTKNIVAALFAPGSALQRENSGITQSRDCGGDATCNSTGICSTPLTAPLCLAVNYLDILTNIPGVVGNVDNASFDGDSNSNIIAGPIIAANDPQNVFVNDQVLTISANDLLPIVSKRVLRDVGNLITSFSPPYPEAAQDSSTGSDCLGHSLEKLPATANNGDDAGITSVGLVPYNALKFGSTSASYNMLCNNDWFELIKYQSTGTQVEITLGDVRLQCDSGSCSVQ